MCVQFNNSYYINREPNKKLDQILFLCLKKNHKKSSYHLLLILLLLMLCCCWLDEFLVCLILLKFGIVFSIIFIIFVILLLLLWFQWIVIIIYEIRIEIVPFVNWYDDKVSVTFIRYVNRNKRISILVIKVIYWCDMWIIIWWRCVLCWLVVWIENIYGILARSWWRW